MFMDQRDLLRAVGDPDQVKAKIDMLASSFKADEMMFVSNMYHFEDRKHCFALLSEMV